MASSILIVRQPGAPLRQIPLNGKSISIGSAARTNIPIQNPWVSHLHAEIIPCARGYAIKDLSKNGTFVGEQRLPPKRLTLLRHGDVVYLGDVRKNPASLTFYQLQSQAPPIHSSHAARRRGVRLDAVRLLKDDLPRAKWRRRVLRWVRKHLLIKPTHRVLLNDISLTVMPGDFVAILGEAGSGKSTLLDALCGRRRVHGQVFLDGDNLYSNFDVYRRQLGYVSQQNILHSAIPVKRALTYTARLRLPFESAEAIKYRVQKVLTLLRLTGQANLRVSSPPLSGGQLKRVNIASELICEPNVLFLDEPTTGLDNFSAKEVMHDLKRIHDEGHTIVMVTHLTKNILGNCNRLAFIAHGRLVYFGPLEQAASFFGVRDLDAIYGVVRTPTQAEEAERSFKSSQVYWQFVAQPHANMPRPGLGSPRPKRTPLPPRMMLRQFGILVERYFDLIRGDWQSLLLLVFVMPIIGLMLDLILKSTGLVGDTNQEIARIVNAEHFYQIVNHAQQVLLMLGLAAVVLGFLAAVFEIIKERAIYERERMNNLEIMPYLASKIAVLTVFAIVQCFMLLVMVSFQVQLPEAGVVFPAPLEMYFTLVLAMVTSVCFGLLVSAVVKSRDSIIYLVFVVLFIQIIFSGGPFVLPEPAQALPYLLTQTRWVMEALGASVNMNALNDLSTPIKMDLTINYARSVGHLFGIWMVQVAFATVFTTLTAVVLRMRDAH